MITAQIEGETHSLENTEGKITLVCKSAELSTSEITYAQDGKPAISLDFEVASYHADRVDKLHDKTESAVKKVFPLFTWPSPKPWPNPLRHIVGLIDMTYKLTDLGVVGPIVWKYPEAFLHPAESANLADVVIEMHKYLNSKT